MSIHRVTFESLSAAVKLATSKGDGQTPSGARVADALLADINSGSKRKFFGSYYRTVEDFANAPANPNPEVLDAVEKAREELAGVVRPPVRRRRKMKRRLPEGDEMCPNAWLCRDPEAWTQVQRIIQEAKTARIAVNCVVSAGESLSALLWQGAAAVAVADLLTMAGVSVEVVALAYTNGLSTGSPEMLTEVILKPAHAPVDLAVISTALADTSFYRGIMLAAEARSGKGIVSFTLGMPAPVPDPVKAEFDLVLDRTHRGKGNAMNAVEQMMKGRELN